MAAPPYTDVVQLQDGNRWEQLEAPVRDAQEPTFHFKARPPKAEPEAQVLSAEHEALEGRLRGSPVTVRPDLRGALAAIRRTAEHLKSLSAKDLDWKGVARAGPILSVTVAPESIQRTLRIADAILRAAEELGRPFKSPPKKEGTPTVSDISMTIIAGRSGDAFKSSGNRFSSR